MSLSKFKNYSGVGIYWTNHVHKAESYNDMSSENWITLRAIDNLNDIDWEFMTKFYSDVSSPWEELESGFGESEIRLKKGSTIFLTGYDTKYPEENFTEIEVFVKS